MWDLLQPSTTPEMLAHLAQTRQRKGSQYVPYLKLKQKQMNNVDRMLADGAFHGGAHFPLCVFTDNSGARSEVAQRRRADRMRDIMKAKGKDTGKGVAAVAGKGSAAGYAWEGIWEAKGSAAASAWTGTCGWKG